jgi:hypothetical protein
METQELLAILVQAQREEIRAMPEAQALTDRQATQVQRVRVQREEVQAIPDRQATPDRQGLRL